MSISLDKADREILSLVQEDATLTHQDIAERAGMSATSVWRRLKNLEEVGVIDRRVALLDRKKTGMQICALINIRLVRHGEDTRVEFEDFIASRPEVLECYAIIGSYDYAMIVIVANMEEYEKFLTRHLLSHELVAASTSTLTLRQVKYSTVLDLR